MDYLSRLPIDRLKLDRSLVRHLGVEKKSAIVLRSIITLGAELGLDVIAEGVETELQLQMLRDLGCPRAQGFLLGRPMSAQRAFATVSKPWGNRRAPDLRHPSPAVQAVPCVRARSLTQILGENALICERLQQAVDELSARRAPSGSESVDDLLRDAVGRMAVVNRALEDEIRDRTMADHQLAAALEQEAGSRQAALHDHLTGLPNRVLFNDRLEHALAHARRHGWILAVMFVDLDDFKNINDTHGHRAGDEVLKIIAQRLTQNTRNDDTISRYGGDEYLCLLTPLGETCEMAVIAAQILLAIQAPCEVQGGDGVIQLNLQASIGIAMFPKDGATAAALVASADDAMYRAKKSGIGVEFAQDGRQPGDRAAAYRPDARVDVTSSHAPTLVSDVKPSRNHPALPLTGGLAVRTH
jgi:diguanylate cyclase (GGDEF)-like protein